MESSSGEFSSFDDSSEQTEIELKSSSTEETEYKDVPKTEELDNQQIDIETESIQTENDDEAKSKPESEKKDEWDDVLGSGGLLKKILKEGQEDTRPKRLELCTINYKCTLEDGKEVEKGENVIIQLSDLEVIQGVDLGLTLMNVGEKSIFKIQPRLAYGSQGLDTRVPPDTSVFYEVELLKVEEEIEMENLTILQRKKIGDKKKKRGNWWYSRGECTFAIQCYRRALDYLDEVECGISEPISENDDPKQRELTDAALQDLMEDRINVSNNMAAAQMKQGAYDAALQSLHIVLRCQPNNVKALYRKSKVLKAKNDIQEALKCLQKAKQLEPDNTTIQKEIQEINIMLKKHKNYEKELARRMFNGTALKKESNAGEPEKKNTSFMWASVVLSVAVGIGVAAWRFKFS